MTVADTVYDVINDNWGGGGYGGAAPSIDNTESDVTTDSVKADVIEVRHYTVNDTYTNRGYFIDIFISSTTSAAQLKLIVDEVEYLLRNTAMTDLQFVNVTKDYSVTKWMQAKHAVILKVELVSLMSSGAITPASSTGYNWHEAMMITSTYAAWVPLGFYGADAGLMEYTGGLSMSIIDANVDMIFYQLSGIPPLKGSLKLYISGVRVDLDDADASNYIDRMRVLGMSDGAGWATLNDNNTNYTAAEYIEYTFAGVDASAHDTVGLYINLVSANAGNIDIRSVMLRCYYDT